MRFVKRILRFWRNFLWEFTHFWIFCLFTSLRCVKKVICYTEVHCAI